MREVFNKKPKYQALTQGSIITGCIATNYPSCEVWGCVITSRCDLYNSKVNTVHYLPIVSFEDWLKKEIVGKIKSQWFSKLKEKLASCLRSKKVSDAFLDRGLSDQDFERIVNKYFKDPQKSQVLNDYRSWKYPNGVSLGAILSTKEGNGLLKNEIDKLIKNDCRSYYLIEGWKQSMSNDYKVILLSEIKTISIALAQRLPDGITEDSLSESDFRNNDFVQTPDRSSIYYVDTELKSPFIEHVVQRFVNNFSRIGVEDIPKEDVSTNLVEYSNQILNE